MHRKPRKLQGAQPLSHIVKAFMCKSLTSSPSHQMQSVMYLKPAGCTDISKRTFSLPWSTFPDDCRQRASWNQLQWLPTFAAQETAEIVLAIAVWQRRMRGRQAWARWCRWAGCTKGPSGRRVQPWHKKSSHGGDTPGCGRPSVKSTTTRPISRVSAFPPAALKTP